MDILNNGPTAGCPLTPDSRCSICLDDLTNNCYTNACFHLFCFDCLQRWSDSEPTCPLCKKTFNYIYHSFGDLGIHETYTIPIIARTPGPIPRSPRSPSPDNIRQFSEMSNGNRSSFESEDGGLPRISFPSQVRRGSLDRPIDRRRRISSMESEYADLPRISFQSQVGRGSPN
ncbi:E3 ubiquitin-protein ligase RNF185-like [Metopolophium dirhodum]|uniref:E3 ubiquitin-protein ligase RNF185-like n=1 Tax=Metopolophium dirhodum TaxID=44670 RepID=UPI00298FBBF3|nr:E3 ubiquitin-protein ligase RNF185-like [Metopolophium dirhodum]XP_060859759.1 E3 ubiquitin-protein ligase RNF185-like [Metopolophium dirhodum]